MNISCDIIKDLRRYIMTAFAAKIAKTRLKNILNIVKAAVMNYGLWIANCLSVAGLKT